MILKSLCVILALTAAASAKVGEEYVAFLKRTQFQEADKLTLVRGLSIASHENQSGVSVTLYILNGRICAEEYRRLTKEQALELLSRQGEKWETVAEGNGREIASEWKAAGLHARHFISTLTIKTPIGEKAIAELERVNRERLEKEERRKVDGF